MSRPLPEYLIHPEIQRQNSLSRQNSLPRALPEYLIHPEIQRQNSLAQAQSAAVSSLPPIPPCPTPHEGFSGDSVSSSDRDANTMHQQNTNTTETEKHATAVLERSLSYDGAGLGRSSSMTCTGKSFTVRCRPSIVTVKRSESKSENVDQVDEYEVVGQRYSDYYNDLRCQGEDVVQAENIPTKRGIAMGGAEPSQPSSGGLMTRRRTLAIGELDAALVEKDASEEEHDRENRRSLYKRQDTNVSEVLEEMEKTERSASAAKHGLTRYRTREDFDHTVIFECVSGQSTEAGGRIGRHN